LVVFVFIGVILDKYFGFIISVSSEKSAAKLQG